MVSKIILALGTAVAVVLFAMYFGVGVLAGPPSPLQAPGTDHPHRSPSPAEQDHATGGPYISIERATMTALAIGIGNGVPANASLESVAQASADLGFRAASGYVGADREVWLVKVNGPYKPTFWLAGNPPQFDHYYVVIDATTGHVLATGSQPVQ